MATVANRLPEKLLASLALTFGAVVLALPVAAAGVDSRTYTCAGLQALIAEHGFVFISQATFGDFAVADRSICAGADVPELRSVATSDNPQCLINYCVSRDSTAAGGGN